MEKVLEIFKQECFNADACYRTMRNELFFDLDTFHISVRLGEDFETEIDEDFSPIEAIDISKISKSSVEKICVMCGAPVYYDEDYEDENDEPKIPYNSIAQKLSEKIKTNYPDGIANLEIGEYCVDDSYTMCDEVWEKGFLMEIAEKYWDNVPFFQCVIQELKQLLTIEIRNQINSKQCNFQTVKY